MIKILSHKTTCINLSNVLLSEELKKKTYPIDYAPYDPINTKFQKTQYKT